MDLALAVSRLSLLECLVAPLRRGDQVCLDGFEALFAQPDLVVVELSASVVELATQLRANDGLRTPDALQADCCLQLGPDAVMITGDVGFQRVQALQVRLMAGTCWPDLIRGRGVIFPGRRGGDEDDYAEALFYMTPTPTTPA